MTLSMTSKPANALLAAAVSMVRSVHTESSVPAPRTTRDLFDAHSAFLLRLVRHLGVPSSDAEDVTQEVFMIAHQRLTTLQHQESARSWLFGIARRVAANHVRKIKRRRTDSVLPIEELSAATSGDPALELELARDRALLLRALDRLDADKRAVFVLFELEGLAMPEVAEMIGCPINTAYSRLYAARVIVQRSVLGTRAMSSAPLTGSTR
jgi:RNA polymerase sigma-70 factor (ECF subfamily)